MDTKKIKEALLASRGLPPEMTDAQARTIWHSLDATTQEGYLAKVEKDTAGKTASGSKRQEDTG